MKIILCNIPIRSEPTDYPPVACTSLLNYLKANGYDGIFYDLDVKRPSFEELSSFFRREKFDIVGISAVISTGYKYVKELAEVIKEASPSTKIVLGGNLAVAYEIILKKCRIDICAIGEGEKILLNLVRHLERYSDFNPLNGDLRKIKGIVFMNQTQDCEFTGQEEPNDFVSQPDYELIVKFSDIDNYICDPLTRIDYLNDPRTLSSHRQGKRIAAVIASKGCVNKCTFCHRWIKGYRINTVENVINAMKHLIDKYNVGFFRIVGECFVENLDWLEDFIKQIKPLDILFDVGAARVSLVKKDPSIIKRLKEVGLTTMYFGMESGSDKVLKIMEKNATRNENLKAAQLCAEAGVFSSVQLVIGMPGENERTINETIEFVKAATGDLPYPPQISPNYLQSLPGTPSYEYLRKRGFLGKTIDDEERYLLKVSDVNAAELRQYINVSEEPISRVSLWQRKVCMSTRIYWIKRHGYDKWLRMMNYNFLADAKIHKKDLKGTIYLNIKKFIFNSPLVTYGHIKLFEDFYWKFSLFRQRCVLYGIARSVLITFGVTKEEDRSRFKTMDISLRKILQEI